MPIFGIILIAAALGALFRFSSRDKWCRPPTWTLAFRWHLVFALAAYSFMMIAFVQAVLMMLQNTRLRAKGLSANDDLLVFAPGLVVMERVFFRIVATGFFCLTLVLILGGGCHEGASGRSTSFFDHKAVLTWISWLVFGVLLLGRTVLGLARQDGSASFLGGICCLCGCLFCLQLRS